mgnify:CR=1 FL=1
MAAQAQLGQEVIAVALTFFPRNRSHVFSASLIILKTISSMVAMDRQPFERLVR